MTNLVDAVAAVWTGGRGAHYHIAMRTGWADEQPRCAGTHATILAEYRQTYIQRDDDSAVLREALHRLNYVIAAERAAAGLKASLICMRCSSEYADYTDPSVKLHQQDHDLIGTMLNRPPVDARLNPC